MSNKYKILIIFIIVFQFSCSNKAKEKINYSNIKIENFLYDHFPKEICTKKYLLDTYTNEERNNIAIFLKFNDCLVNKNSLIKLLDSLSIAKYNHNNGGCNFIINSTETSQSLISLERVLDSLDFNNIDCDYKSKYPIPNFNIYYEKFDKDYDVYVFEAKKGEYSDLYKFNYNKLMPSYWNHGYSKGIAFNKNTDEIIYWGYMW